GVGMDAQTVARVFEPFFTTKPVGVGTGLGMSMAYGLVKQHRGYLHIYSEVAQGTTAKVYLPAVRDQGMSELEAAADEGLPGGTETILLVEDDQTMRVAAQQLLSKVGYRVVTAVDGQQGLDAYHAHRAGLHLVITDVVMPKLSGFELYKVIRGESRGLSVLFMSGFPAPNFRKTVGQDPAVAFVTNPWTASSSLAVQGLVTNATAGSWPTVWRQLRGGKPPLTILLFPRRSPRMTSYSSNPLSFGITTSVITRCSVARWAR